MGLKTSAGNSLLSCSHCWRVNHPLYSRIFTNGLGVLGKNLSVVGTRGLTTSLLRTRHIQLLNTRRGAYLERPLLTISLAERYAPLVQISLSNSKRRHHLADVGDAPCPLLTPGGVFSAGPWRLTTPSSTLFLARGLHLGRGNHTPPDEKSKVEQSVEALKEKKKEMSPGQKPVKDLLDLPKKSLWQRFVEELKHYYHGFRLFGVELRIACSLIFRILRGHSMTRRERRQLIRTTADIFRVVPFSVFIIVPMAELLLPVFVKLFPGMLPSTFEEASKKDEKLKKQLKLKLEMAKFLQDTIEETAIQPKKKGGSADKRQEFAAFIEKVRVSGVEVTNEEILRFSKLFEDELTLDNLPRPQLVALCKLLLLQPFGTNNFLRFQLRMKLRTLKADDKMIQNEGVASLTVPELQSACQARGMRALGVSTDRLQLQLQQWLDLHLNEKIPTSLLLLSRTLYLPETLPVADKLKETLSSLPDDMTAEAELKLAEVEGEKVDYKKKIDVIKKEEEEIKKERKEREREEAEEKDKRKAEEIQTPDSEVLPDEVKPAGTAARDEVLQDVAPTLKAEEVEKEEITAEEIKEISQAIQSLSDEKSKLEMEKEDLEELKEDVQEYTQDVEDLKEAATEVGLQQEVKVTKASTRLSKRVDRMIGQMEDIITQLDESKDRLDTASTHPATQQRTQALKCGMVTIEELLAAIKKLHKVQDDAKLRRIADLLDDDKDGIVNIEHIVKVLEVMEDEDINLNAEHISEIMELVNKEENIEILEKNTEKKE